MDISVAIATHNEESSIGECLESVCKWANEIVVVDGDSTDDTVEIAKKYNARIYSAKNESMFHINKQKALDKCTHDWILQLDADEVVTLELKKAIENVIHKDSPKYDSLVNGYWLPRKNLFLTRYLMKGGQFPDYSLRLYRRGKGKLPCKSVHEQAIVEGETKYLSVPLLHKSYPDFAHYLEHFNLYTTILARELADSKTKINTATCINFFIFKPLYWFLFTFIRHKGVSDGFPGFVFSLFSSLRFPVAYIKLWEGLKKGEEIP